MAKRQADLDRGVERMLALSGTANDVTFKVTRGVTRPVWEPDAGTMALYEKARGLAKAMGIELPHGSAGGGSDANFTGAMGIPTLDGLGVRGADAAYAQRTYRGRQPCRARPADGGIAGDAGVRSARAPPLTECCPMRTGFAELIRCSAMAQDSLRTTGDRIAHNGGSTMLGYLLRRMLAAIPVMGVVALFVFLLLRLTPGRSRRDPGRRQCDAGAARAHPHLARPQRAALHPVLHLDRQAAAWRSRRIPDLERAGAEDDRPARRAVDLDRAVDHHPLHPGRGAARRDRGVEARHLDRPLRDGPVGGRLLGAGVRDRLCPDPDLCDRPALGAGAGLQEHHRRASGRSSSASSCRPARCPSSMSR